MNGMNSKIEECPVQTLKISSSLPLSRTGAGGTKVGRVLGPGLSSVSINGLMVSRNSSKPCRRPISLKPRSDRHNGLVLALPSSPPYHLSTHTSQPRIFLQQRVKITGGLMGEEWHICHLKVSRSCKYSPGGSRMPLERVNTAFISFCMLFTTQELA